jgi:hypothetical protein
LGKYCIQIHALWHRGDSYCHDSVSVRDAVQFLKGKQEIKASAYELDAEIDTQILTVGLYMIF